MEPNSLPANSINKFLLCSAGKRSEEEIQNEKTIEKYCGKLWKAVKKKIKKCRNGGQRQDNYLFRENMGQWAVSGLIVTLRGQQQNIFVSIEFEIQ